MADRRPHLEPRTSNLEPGCHTLSHRAPPTPETQPPSLPGQSPLLSPPADSSPPAPAAHPSARPSSRECQRPAQAHALPPRIRRQPYRRSATRHQPPASSGLHLRHRRNSAEPHPFPPAPQSPPTPQAAKAPPCPRESHGSPPRHPKPAAASSPLPRKPPGQHSPAHSPAPAHSGRQESRTSNFQPGPHVLASAKPRPYALPDRPSRPAESLPSSSSHYWQSSSPPATRSSCHAERRSECARGPARSASGRRARNPFAAAKVRGPETPDPPERPPAARSPSPPGSRRGSLPQSKIAASISLSALSGQTEIVTTYAGPSCISTRGTITPSPNGATTNSSNMFDAALPRRPWGLTFHSADRRPLKA